MGFIGKMVDKIKGNKKELTQSEIAEKKSRRFRKSSIKT